MAILKNSFISHLLKIAIPEFKFTTRSPFMTLFRGKMNRVQIKCDDSKLKDKIESNPHFIELKDFSAKFGFEPFTFEKVKNLRYEMKTEYSLQFQERTQELPSLIQFHKALIDFVI
jgi:hypothetical protein